MRHLAYRRYSTATPENPQQLMDCKIVFTNAFQDHCAAYANKRPALEQLKQFVQAEDSVHVASIDRLCRHTRDLLQWIRYFQSKGENLMFHDEQLRFSAQLTEQEQAMLKLIEALAASEEALIGERQRDGIHKAKSKGATLGRPVIDKGPVRALIAEGVTGTEIALLLNCSLRTVQRIAREDSEQ
jgi:DNA invertase Pin-like site-specific DNA recombinase